MRRRGAAALPGWWIAVLVGLVLVVFAVVIHVTGDDGPTPGNCRYVGVQEQCASPGPSSPDPFGTGDGPGDDGF